ncbi:MAG: hypothetical protein WAT58_08845 [Candidatus Dormiibacterota bacterium]
MISGEQASGEHAQPARGDTSATALQILATEHWSLLATRSLTYTESLSRVTMFLSVLSAAVVALAFLAQVDNFHEAFNIAAVLVLSVVLFIGLATVGRLSTLNREDARWVMGMNRLRRAYLELHPELEPYFMTASHDDQRGIMLTLGVNMPRGGFSILDLLHGFQTLPLMMGVIVSVVAGVWASLIGAWVGVSTPGAVAIGVALFFLMVVAQFWLARRNFIKFISEVTPAFPAEPS